MKARQYTEEQIIAVLKEGEAGTGVRELCRKYGMSDATYYKWKAKYAGLTVSDLKKLNGEKLTNAERLYRQKIGNKLRPEKAVGRISEAERNRIIELNSRGLTTNDIVRMTGRSEPSVKSILKKLGLASPHPRQAAIARAEKERIIRQAITEGKSVNQIVIETHTWRKTVREVVKAIRWQPVTATEKPSGSRLTRG